MVEGECVTCGNGKTTVFLCLAKSAHYGVVVARKANIWFVNTSTVAVLVAAALRWTVVSNKSKVTPAHSWGHTRPIHTPLCTHWLTLTRNTAREKNKMKRFKQASLIALKSDTVVSKQSSCVQGLKHTWLLLILPAEYVTLFTSAVESLR